MGPCAALTVRCRTPRPTGSTGTRPRRSARPHGLLQVLFQASSSPGLDGTETFDIALPPEIVPRGDVQVTATRADGTKKTFAVVCRLDSAVEINYYRNGGILHTVLRKLLNESKKPALVGA